MDCYKLLNLRLFIIYLLLSTATCNAQTNTTLPQTTDVGQELSALKAWQAGHTVSVEAIRQYGGIDHCFTSSPIPDEVWEKMQGQTYRPNNHISRDDLRHLHALHYDIDNRIYIGEMICNRRIADILVKIFRQLFDAKYPIHSMLLPETFGTDDETQMRANNSSCFCYRTVSGSSSLSKHAQGLAIDINPLYNPYIKKRTNGTQIIQPSTAKPYSNRLQTFPYKIDTAYLAYRLFTQNGFLWGGNWKSLKDYQHFEWKGK